MIQDPLDICDDNDTEPVESTVKYLNHVEESLYSEISYRKKIDSGLLFISCQITSTSVAWIFASMQISTSIMMAACIAIALIPGIVDAGDSFRVELSSERWEIHHAKPFTAISKLAIGMAISWNSSQAIARDIWRTESNIRSVYTDIRNNNSKGWLSIPVADAMPLVIGFMVALIFVLIKSNKGANEK